MVVVLLTVVIITLNQFKKRAKAECKTIKNGGVISSYWQAIVFSSFGAILLLVLLIKAFV